MSTSWAPERIDPGQFWRYVGPPPGRQGAVHKVLLADVHEIVTVEWNRLLDDKVESVGWLGDQEEFMKNFKPA